MINTSESTDLNAFKISQFKNSSRSFLKWAFYFFCFLFRPRILTQHLKKKRKKFWSKYKWKIIFKRNPWMNKEMNPLLKMKELFFFCSFVSIPFSMTDIEESSGRKKQKKCFENSLYDIVVSLNGLKREWKQRVRDQNATYTCLSGCHLCLSANVFIFFSVSQRKAKKRKIFNCKQERREK